MITASPALAKKALDNLTDPRPPVSREGRGYRIYLKELDLVNLRRAAIKEVIKTQVVFSPIIDAYKK